MDYFIVWVGVRLSRKLRLYRHIRCNIVLELQLPSVDIVGMAEGIVEEGIVGEETVDVETVEEFGYEENGFLDGISSTQETKKSVGLVVVSKGSRSGNFA